MINVGIVGVGHLGEIHLKLILSSKYFNLVGFYEKVGFKHETTLKDHYYKDQDERVYTIFFKNRYRR